jgi:UTP--glucose-1-phosphate uridylyltransferase
MGGMGTNGGHPGFSGEPRVRIRKAVITAAGRGSRVYPAADTVGRGMLPIVDRDGRAKPVIQAIAEEAFSCGVDEIGIVCAPGDEARYLSEFRALIRNRYDARSASAEYLSGLLERFRYIVQDEPKGYGHAVWCARSFTGDEPFLLLLNDHLYLSTDPHRRCAQQVVELAGEEECAVSGVRATRESLIGNFGTLAGRHVAGRPGLYAVERLLEKPSISVAELELATPGLRAAHYLCFFGMHVLTPGIFPILEEQMRDGEGNGNGVQLTPALEAMGRREQYLALEVQGFRYDIGQKYGLLQAQLALGLSGKEREEVLASLVDVMAETHQNGQAERREGALEPVH